MFITACVLAIVAAGLVVSNGLNSAQLVKSTTLRRVVIAGSLIAAGISAALIFETLVPAEPQKEGVLLNEGDEVALGDVSGGVLYVVCESLEGAEKTHGVQDVRLVITGADGKQKSQSRFQNGPKKSETDPKPENLAANVRLDALGADTKVGLMGISPKEKVSVHVAYRPHRFPVQIALIVLGVLALLAAAYEGAAPAGWRRTFLTTVLIGVGAFVWMLEDGLTVEDSVWTMWIRLAYGVCIGAIAGTLLPAMTGAMLPPLEAGPKDSVSPPAA